MLQTLLAGMDVPAGRMSDLNWLRRNLPIRNGDNPNFAEAMRLILREFRNNDSLFAVETNDFTG